jgi:3' exoribonuclease, RNase T-like
MENMTMPGINNEFTDIMLDLETLGTVPGCAIVSVGAVAFNEFGVHDVGFYRVIEIPEWDVPGLTPEGLMKDVGTIDWWKKQNPAALTVFHAANAISTREALSDLARYIMEFGGMKARVWGNGADFDLPIVTVAAKTIGLEPKNIWAGYNGRCYRTAKNQAKDVKLARSGTHHNALDDAINQARHLVDICQRRGWRLA